LDAAWEPIRIYFTCYKVLQALNDPRSEEILENAFEILDQQVSLIPVEEDKKKFLENIPWHRKLTNLKKQNSKSH
jgi:hypothetical protein